MKAGVDVFKPVPPRRPPTCAERTGRSPAAGGGRCRARARAVTPRARGQSRPIRLHPDSAGASSRLPAPADRAAAHCHEVQLRLRAAQERGLIDGVDRVGRDEMRVQRAVRQQFAHRSVAARPAECPSISSRVPQARAASRERARGTRSTRRVRPPTRLSPPPPARASGGARRRPLRRRAREASAASAAASSARWSRGSGVAAHRKCDVHHGRRRGVMHARSLPGLRPRPAQQRFAPGLGGDGSTSKIVKRLFSRIRVRSRLMPPAVEVDLLQLDLLAAQRHAKLGRWLVGASWEVLRSHRIERERARNASIPAPGMGGYPFRVGVAAPSGPSTNQRE